MMHHKNRTQVNNILMIDDNPTDVLLMKEAFALCGSTSNIFVAEDGVHALEFLKKQNQFQHVPRPDIILLDLNMPKRSGLDVLAELKSDPELDTIPVIIYTSSAALEDVKAAYQKHANAYIKKSGDFESCIRIAKLLKDFWLSTAILIRPD